MCVKHFPCLVLRQSSHPPAIAWLGDTRLTTGMHQKKKKKKKKKKKVLRSEAPLRVLHAQNAD